ncbi:arginase family protein [uncultured Phocaeicola sp.]|uniref:arginase family protein n=1 Tax=uncultured Phocaeicola sp. TaxID=990718 RepID=UPI002587CAE3|nr:arginase family protein [uncultured Phocaeicola sp.]
MENKVSTIRLIYPQWQGGMVDHWMPDIPAEDASRGYYLGAQLLNFLAPESSQETIEIPVSLDINDRQTDKGVSARRVILKQTKAALEKLRETNPEKIVTLGGECSVSVVPFTFLAGKYPDDVAIVWIDAHPDVNLPYDNYKGYHAMALTACLGMGDEEIIRTLPGRYDASRALIVGVRSWDDGMKERQKELGIKGLSPEEVAEDSSAILEWLKSTGVSKVVIHFDLDVLDPAEIIAGVGVEPDGMKINEAVRVINDIASEYDLIGLTVAEPMPRVAIKIRNMLNQLPLIK